MRVPDPEIYDIAVREYNILTELKDHSAVIKVHDIFYNRIQENVFILMEYVENGFDL